MGSNYSYTEEVMGIVNYFHEKRMKEHDLRCLEGVWNENTSWEFYLSDYLPEPNLCTAVFALLKHKGKVVLTKTHRGWEMPGGHIEEGETIEEALQREILEEAGAHVVRFKLIGYRKIITKKQNLNGRNANYPFPFSYIPHYIAVAEADLVKPMGDKDEIQEAGEFSPDELYNLNSEVMPIIEVCLRRFNEIE